MLPGFALERFDFAMGISFKSLTPTKISGDYKLLYNKECEQRNLSLFMLVSMCMFVFEVLLLIFQYVRLGSLLFEILYFYVYIFTAIFGGTFSIIYYLYKHGKLKKNRLTVDFLFVFFFIILALSTSYAELSIATNFLQNSIFIIAMFSLTSLVYLDYKQILALLIFGVAVFIAQIYFSNLLTTVKVGIILDYLLLFVLNFCTAIVFHNSRVEKFIQKVEIEEANKNLQNTNAQLETLNKQLEQTAITDALTGVLNRMAFNNILKTQWTFSVQNIEPISALMIDVDHFKNYNDTYGHMEGDRCLQKVAQAIVKSLRKTGDFVFRYGGEEFTCILPSTDLNGAIIASKRIMEELKGSEILTKEGGAGVTVSIGINHCVPTKDDDMYKFIENADKALYKSKNNGRNMYTIYND